MESLGILESFETIILNLKGWNQYKQVKLERVEVSSCEIDSSK